MSVSLQKHKSQLNELSLEDDDRKEFMNPISKITFEALPRIYGRRKKKKYAIKTPIEESGIVSYRHHCNHASTLPDNKPIQHKKIVVNFGSE